MTPLWFWLGDEHEDWLRWWRRVRWQEDYDWYYEPDHLAELRRAREGYRRSELVVADARA